MAKRFRAARAKAGLPEELVLYCSRHDFGSRLLDRDPYSGPDKILTAKLLTEQ